MGTASIIRRYFTGGTVLSEVIVILDFIMRTVTLKFVHFDQYNNGIVNTIMLA